MEDTIKIKNIEPNFKKASCAYCGDAPVPHTIFYILNLIGDFLDNHIKEVASIAPDFLKRFAEWFPSLVFRTFVFFRMARFSSDIHRVKTFRSRVIWEEAERRGIQMEQLILWGKPLEYYRAKFQSGKVIYFESIPIPPKFPESKHSWDDKGVLKKEFMKEHIPVPKYIEFSTLGFFKPEKIFESLTKPIIVKPRLGSRGRHTITNITTFAQFLEAIAIGKKLSPSLIAEEHLEGYVCRATVVGGKLAGFYRGEAPSVVGNGIDTIERLIEKRNDTRPDRVEKIILNEELKNQIRRAGYSLENILEPGKEIKLTHRVGRLFGGHTCEMLTELHPSFVPIFEKAARVTGLPVAGFDCIVPNPENPEGSQRWGIIECNTLPFIDLHYYALEGKPQNIAGMIWDMWS